METTTRKQILTEKLENEIIKSIQEKGKDNPMAGTPLEGMFLLEIMNETSDEFRGFLNENQEQFGLSNDDIDSIISNGFSAIHNKIFDNEEKEDAGSNQVVEDGFTDPLDIFTDNDDPIDKLKISTLFYQFCFSYEIAKLFLDKSEFSEQIAKKMVETTSVSGSVPFAFFKTYLEKFDVEIEEYEHPEYYYKNVDFSFLVEKIVIGDDSTFFEMLSNNFTNVVDVDSNKLAVANNYLVYVKNYIPNSLYAVIRDPFLGKYAVRRIYEDGISSNIGFIENNERDTILDKILEQESLS